MNYKITVQWHHELVWIKLEKIFITFCSDHTSMLKNVKKQLPTKLMFSCPRCFACTQHAPTLTVAVHTRANNFCLKKYKLKINNFV